MWPSFPEESWIIEFESDITWFKLCKYEMIHFVMAVWRYWNIHLYLNDLHKK